MLYGNGTSRSCLKLQYWSICWNGIDNLSQLAARDVITKAYFVTSLDPATLKSSGIESRNATQQNRKNSDRV